MEMIVGRPYISFVGKDDTWVELLYEFDSGALIFSYYVFCYFVYICLLEKCGIVIICRSVRIAHMTTANREAPYVFSCGWTAEPTCPSASKRQQGNWPCVDIYPAVWTGFLLAKKIPPLRFVPRVNCCQSSPKEALPLPRALRVSFDTPPMGLSSVLTRALFTSPFQPKIFPLPPITSNLSTHVWSIKCR
jgi:hypothetical protein